MRISLNKRSISSIQLVSLTYEERDQIPYRRILRESKIEQEAEAISFTLPTFDF